MLGPDQFNDLPVDQGRGLRGACQGSISAQILVIDRFQGDHTEIIAHAVAGDHGPGHPGGPFNIIGSAGGNRAELYLLRRAAAAEGGDLIFHLGLAHQVMIALFLDLHGITQSAGGTGNDRDLLYRSRMGLHGCHQGMADLMVGHDQLFLVGQDGVLLLITGNDHLDAFLQIRLGGEFPAVPDGPQGRFIDDIGQLRAGSAGCHSGDLVEIHILRHLDLAGVDPEDILTAFQVGQLNGHAPVESSRPGQGRIQGFRPVGGCQDHNAQILFKAVHLRQQLVQGLLSFIIAAEIAGVTLFADGVDLINKYDTGRFLLGLAEEVPYLGGTHTDEHLNEFRAGHGEERHIGFTGHGLGQHGLAGSGRAHQQNALGHGGADFLIFAGIMQIFYDLLQVFLGFLFSGHVRETDSLRGFDIHLGVAPAHAEHHGIGTAHLVHHPFGQHPVDGKKDDHGKYPAQYKGHDR